MQDTLDVKVERHPMWNPPTHRAEHLNVLRQEIRWALTPIDGAEFTYLEEFYRRAYHLTTESSGTGWLGTMPAVLVIGHLTMIRAGMVDRIERILKHRTDLSGHTRTRLRQQIKTIHDKGDRLALAVANSAVRG